MGYSAQSTKNNSTVGLESAHYAYDVTPNNSTDLAIHPRALYIGSGGDLTVLMKSENDDIAVVTFHNLPDAFVLDIAVRRVMTASTASDIVALV
jgi:hypothetical protein